MLLFGFKTEAALDVWSLEHFINGISMAAAAKGIIEKFFLICKLQSGITPAVKKIITFLLVLAAALFWENAEHYVERGLLPGNAGLIITNWFAGAEHWSNRLVADNILVMLGWYVYNSVPKKEDLLQKKQTILFWAARIFSAVWMFFHIFIFPDSMYLHRM